MPEQFRIVGAPFTERQLAAVARLHVAEVFEAEAGWIHGQ